MKIFIDHFGDRHKHYRMAITSILYNECLRRRCVTKKGNVAQVEFYNIDFITAVSRHASTTLYQNLHKFLSSVQWECSSSAREAFGFWSDIQGSIPTLTTWFPVVWVGVSIMWAADSEADLRVSQLCPCVAHKSISWERNLSL